jgi:pentatricopeptide repeat protein
MKQLNIEPNITIYNIFIYIYSKNAKYEESIAIFDSALQKRLRINNITVSTLIDGIGFSKDWIKLEQKIQ